MSLFNKIVMEARESRIMDQWRVIESIEQKQKEMAEEHNRLLDLYFTTTTAMFSSRDHASYERTCYLISLINAAKMTMTSMTQAMTEAQDRYNELVIDHEDLIAVKIEEEADLDDADEVDLTFDDGLVDIVVQPRERKTRKDILTPTESIKSHKATKTHKLKPRTVKRDSTKTAESKKKTISALIAVYAK